MGENPTVVDAEQRLRERATRLSIIKLLSHISPAGSTCYNTEMITKALILLGNV